MVSQGVSYPVGHYNVFKYDTTSVNLKLIKIVLPSGRNIQDQLMNTFLKVLGNIAM